MRGPWRASMLRATLVLCLADVACAFLSSSGHRGCEVAFENYRNKLEQCNEETRKLEEMGGKDLERQNEQIAYNRCRIKELNEEWEGVRDEFRKNKYLKPQLIQMDSSLEETYDPNDYYYDESRSGPVEDPKCECVKGIDKCKCLRGCQNLFRSCAARFQSQRHDMYTRWKRNKRIIRQQQARIRGLEGNIRRMRQANKAAGQSDSDGTFEHKYRVTRCGDEPRVVR